MEKLIKGSTYLIFFLVAPWFTACGESDAGPESPEIMNMVMEDLKTNQEVLDKAYEYVSSTVTTETIKNAYKQNSGSKLDFIQAMMRNSEGLLLKAAEETQASMSGYLKIGDIKGESERNARVEKLLLGELPLDNYISLLEQASTDSEHKQWIIIQSYEAAETGSEPAPTETFSLNYEKVTHLIKMTDLIISSATREEEHTVVEDFRIQNGIPPVAIGLLLPAVQHFGTGEGEEQLDLWLDANVENAINGGLNRDIIRRVAFVGSLDALIHREYDNSNQHTASADLLRAQFDVTLMFIWSQVWDEMGAV